MPVGAQQSYMIADNVAVFYPKNFDAGQHLPSPIFVRELVPQGCLKAGWRLQPAYSQQGGHNIVTFNVGADVDLYGTGEVLGDLRRNGDHNIYWNRDNGAFYHNNGKQLYQSHPWVLGVRKDGSAFGIIADNTWKSTLQMGAEIKFDSEGPAFRTVVIERNSAAEVLQELARLSGTYDLPPLWALGYQQCRYSYHPDSKVREIADRMRAERIPCDVIWMDIDYMDGFRIFTFRPDEFPKPKALNDYLHAKNFKAVYMIDPGAKADSSYFVDRQGTAGDYWVKTADGKTFEGNVWPGKSHFPDFTRPEVRSWWAGLYKDFMAQGVDGVWNDMNEPAVFGGPDLSMPEDNMHGGGEGLAPGPHLRYHNQYGFNMVKASREGILRANPDKRPFLLSRSNFLGGQRYAATWTGDNASSFDHMVHSIPMTLNMGLTGQVMNGPDIGGFLGNCTPELLAHWTAIGVYFPFVRNHSCSGTVDQEPWAFGSRVEDVCRTAINRRYRLLPYIYTLFREAAEKGMPVMRPAFMADDRDAALRAEQQVFMLGNDLLIIPRWAKTAALPKGDWDVMPLEKADDGYQAYVALRPGAVVPMANLYQNTVEYRTDSLTLMVNPDARGMAEGCLYEDAGNGYGYRQGDYAEYRLKASVANGRLTVSLEKAAGKRVVAPKTLRVGLVADGKVTYSPWTKAGTVTMRAVKDKHPSINRRQLKWSNLDLTKQPTTLQVTGN